MQTSCSPFRNYEKRLTSISTRGSAGTRHQIDTERDRNDSEKVAAGEMLAQHHPGEQHAERRHQEVIGARGRRAADPQEMEPDDIGQHRAVLFNDTETTE